MFAPQKSRVALARVTWTRPHILLLDEPSNHLDIDAVEALIQARGSQSQARKSALRVPGSLALRGLAARLEPELQADWGPPAAL